MICGIPTSMAALHQYLVVLLCGHTGAQVAGRIRRPLWQPVPCMLTEPHNTGIGNVILNVMSSYTAN